MIYIGAEVKPGDILVGKVTPKGESPITPEEKLLRAIFGEKASDVRDSSLKVPPGVSGTVVDVRIFSRRGIEKDERSRAIERFEIDKFSKDRDDEKLIIEKGFYGKLRELLENQKVIKSDVNLKKGSIITEKHLFELKNKELLSITVEDEKVQDQIIKLVSHFETVTANIENKFSDRVDKLQRGDELLPGVMKMVKVFIAVKRKLQSGDKMAGRHGNKGVISKILPLEDMPHLKDGTPVDVVLNPLGVPSRMNVGQILETHLGWAAYGIGKRISNMLDIYNKEGKKSDIKNYLKDVYGSKYDENFKSMNDEDIIQHANNLKRGLPMATPVFDGANEEDVSKMLELAGLDKSGQIELIDGRTGEYFDRKVTVGYIYMLKLHHLVDDKIHARSIGPYSLVTQQPLGGKAQF